MSNTDDFEIKNAIIEQADLSIDEFGRLGVSVRLDYECSCQGFDIHLNLCESIFRLMQIAGVTDWAKMKGRPVRSYCCWTRIKKIGHIIKDDWLIL